MSGNIWIYLIGLLAQGLFSARILVQWAMSEKARKVVSPTLFWVLSLVASALFFIYGWLRSDFALMLGQVIGYYVYVWNLGIKGIWKKCGNGRYGLVSLLLLLPAAFIVLLSIKNPDSIRAVLGNEDISTALMIFGTIGQLVFSFRFIYQFFYSKNRGESILPMGFWIISIAGSSLILSYGIIRLDPVVILAQSFGLVSYIRNLTIWIKSHR